MSELYNFSLLTLIGLVVLFKNECDYIICLFAKCFLMISSTGDYWGEDSDSVV